MGFWRKLRGHPPETARHLKRNDTCWCGSGKKYKRCHLDADSRYFSRRREAENAACSRYG
jgi:uncharacterized protein YecA (UPF0149 family)